MHHSYETSMLQIKFNVSTKTISHNIIEQQKYEFEITLPTYINRFLSLYSY
jgi:hypothetical protein